jgi:hypothetical protein
MAHYVIAAVLYLQLLHVTMQFRLSLHLSMQGALGQITVRSELVT